MALITSDCMNGPDLMAVTPPQNQLSADQIKGVKPMPVRSKRVFHAMHTNRSSFFEPQCFGGPILAGKRRLAADNGAAEDSAG